MCLPAGASADKTGSAELCTIMSSAAAGSEEGAAGSAGTPAVPTAFVTLVLSIDLAIWQEID
jgi:hypothetical protein